MNRFSRHCRVAAVVMALLMIDGCATNPYSSANKLYREQVRKYARQISRYPLKDSLNPGTAWVGTTNFNLRKPNFVILHHTAQDSCNQTLRTFTTIKTEVSSHYVICRDGTVHHMLNDYLRAWHGGAAKWGNTTDINSGSIGIELDNNGFEPFTDAQIGSLLIVLGRLKKDYNIPTANFIGHADIAPGRKVDPNAWFPWQLLAEHGFGYWYDTSGTRVPSGFNAMQALRIIGYNVKDSAAAITSFKLHFVQNDTSKVITWSDRRILFDLMKKYE